MRSRDQQPETGRAVPLREGIRATVLPIALLSFWLAVGILRDFSLVPAVWLSASRYLMEWSVWLFGAVIAWRQVRRVAAERGWRQNGGTVIDGGSDAPGLEARVEARFSAIERQMADNEQAWRDWNDINGTGGQPFLTVVPRAL